MIRALVLVGLALVAPSPSTAASVAPRSVAPVAAVTAPVAAPLATMLAGEATWTVPKVLIEGRPFRVHVELVVPKNGQMPAALFETAAFTLDGTPISDKKSKDVLELEAGSKIVLDLDLSEAISKSKAFAKKDFKLDLPGSGVAATTVRYVVPVAKGVDFLDEKKMTVEVLGTYLVELQTNRGTMIVEFWPDSAPRHVRNFLDLCASGFYDGVLFHRVVPGFMIQGGDPTTKNENQKAEWGTGGGPRKLNSEFNARKHVRGVLSMARGDDLNSASCQFFVMHAPTPALDGKYTAFGKLLDGLEVVDAIATAPGPADKEGNVRPAEPQRIEKATVLQAPPAKK